MGFHPKFADNGKVFVSGNDAFNNGQKKTGFFSKILRIDVDKAENGKAYGIPEGNPFRQAGGEPETFAYGFRNPYSFSIDHSGAVHAQLRSFEANTEKLEGEGVPVSPWGSFAEDVDGELYVVSLTGE